MGLGQTEDAADGAEIDVEPRSQSPVTETAMLPLSICLIEQRQGMLQSAWRSCEEFDVYLRRMRVS